MGSWATWGRARRALVVLSISNWLVVAALAALAILFEDGRLLLPVVMLLPLDWWLSDRLEQAERAEGAAAEIEAAPITADEQELLDELDTSGSDRAADLVIVRRLLEDDAVLRRHRYPTRELLAVRSASEAVELLGAAIILLAHPALPGVLIGFVLLLLGGRLGARLARAALGRRLYRTPVGDDVRARWLSREERVVVTVSVLLLIVAAQRFLL